MSHALPLRILCVQNSPMPKLAQFIDAFGLLIDDLWSYYEISGRPLWAASVLLLVVPVSWLLVSLV